MLRSILSALTLGAVLSSTVHAEPAEFTAIEIEKRSAGTFYIGGEIDGAGELDMLVDTGSSYLVITEPMLATLKTTGRASYSRGLEGHMADGSVRVVPLYKISSIRLGASCWVHDVEAAIFPAGSRTILGMNVLSRLAPFTFSAEPASLGLAHCQGPPAPVALKESADGDDAAADSGSGAGHADQ
jgi:clan AA aspartic protease (TIGR02281 family)